MAKLYSSPINLDATPAASSDGGWDSLPEDLLGLNLDATPAASSDGGWDSLPEDLLGLIFDKISVYDYVRCATVCKSWFQYVQLHQHDEHRRIMKKKHQLPLLLNPNFGGSETHRIRHIPSSSSSSLISVPYDFKKLRGSSHGWLIFVEYIRLTLTLFNPFTAATIHLPLPPLVLHCGYDLRIKKVVLSDDPSSNPDNYEVLSLQSKGRLALFTSRYDRWIYGDNYFDSDWEYSLQDDIIYFKGKFHALICQKLGSVEIYNNTDKEDGDKPASYIRLEPLKGVVGEIGNLMGELDDLVQSYLAESISETLLYVQRFSLGVSHVTFRVYELEEAAEAEADQQIKRFIRPLLHEGGDQERGLGDQTLFLSYNYHSTSVRACDFPGCKPNSIYFTHSIHYTNKPYNVSVYNLGDEHGRKPLCMLEFSQLFLPQPIWIEPRPNLNL